MKYLYPDATQPTPPRFNVGNIVYTNESVCMPGYTGIDPNDTITITNLMNAHGYTNEQIIRVPSIFGVIINYQEPGTPIIHCHTIGRENFAEDRGEPWGGVEDELEEAVLDIPGSGSIWFLPNNERRYFVKWFNKQPYPLTEKNSDFLPLLMHNSPVFNKSLFPERCLFKAPNFLSKLRNKLYKRKVVESLLKFLLNIDHYSIKGIANIICIY